MAAKANSVNAFLKQSLNVAVLLKLRKIITCMQCTTGHNIQILHEHIEQHTDNEHIEQHKYHTYRICYYYPVFGILMIYT